MLIKLQKQILRLNMILISIVVLLAFAAVYIITWQSIQRENNRILDTQMANMTLTFNAGVSHAESNILYVRQAHVSFESANLFNTFSAGIDAYDNVRSIHTMLDIPQEVYTEVIRMALEQGRDEGTITFSGRDWMYRIVSAQHVPVLMRGQFPPQANQQFQFFEVTESAVAMTRLQFPLQENRQIQFLDITESSLTLRNLMLTLSVVGFVVLFIFYFISFYFSRRAVAPIIKAWEKQKQFIADASHELKTPLTVITTNCDALLENGHETVNSQHKWIDYIQAGTNRMTNLVSQLLLLAKMDDANLTAVPFNINMSKLVLDSIQQLKPMINNKNLKCTHNIESIIILKGDENVSALIMGLLENAVKYADSQIDIKLEKEKRRVNFTVKNDGKGIKKDDLPKIFDRFYRGDESREGNNSYGLGLSIAKTITESLGWKISVDSEEYGDTVFTVMCYSNELISAGVDDII